MLHGRTTGWLAITAVVAVAFLVLFPASLPAVCLPVSSVLLDALPLAQGHQAVLDNEIVLPQTGRRVSVSPRAPPA